MLHQDIMILLPISLFISEAALSQYFLIDDELLLQILIGFDPFYPSPRGLAFGLPWRSGFTRWLRMVSCRSAALLYKLSSFDFRIFILLAHLYSPPLFCIGLLGSVDVLREL